MSTEEAIKILNEREYSDSRKWRVYNPLSPKVLVVNGPYASYGFTEFETIAIAEKLIRESE